MAVDQTFEDTWTLPGNNGIDGRYHDGAFLAMAATSVNPLGAYRDGVLPSAYSSPDYLDLKVISDSPTPGMAVRCYLGQSVISRSSQGPYVSTLRTTGRVDLDASSTTNPRRDLIVAQVLDASIGDADTRTRMWRVTGTPSGTPVLPAVPLGAIPLADVAVAANATQITSANITDLRKAAGIRGAIRLMLPGDSHSDAGIYPGDARYCRTHQQVEVWKNDGVWHGTVTTTADTTTFDTASSTVSKVVASVAIADPGYPYRIRASGSLVWTQGINTWFDLGLRQTNASGTNWGQAVGFSNGGGGLATDIFRQVQGSSGTTALTGAQTVCLCLIRAGGSDATSGANAQSSATYNKFSVEVIPA